MSTNEFTRTALVCAGIAAVMSACAGCSSGADGSNSGTPGTDAGLGTPRIVAADGPTYASVEELAMDSTDVVYGEVTGTAGREEDDGGVQGAPPLTIEFLRFKVAGSVGSYGTPPSGEVVISWTVMQGSEPPQVGESKVLFVRHADSKAYPGIQTQSTWYMPVSVEDGIWDLEGTVASTEKNSHVGALRSNEMASESFSADLTDLQSVVREVMSR